MTFSCFIAEIYLSWAQTNKYSFDKADRVYLKPILAALGDLDLDAISLFQIERYKKERLATPTIHGKQRKPASVNRELECIRRMLAYAVECGYLAENPARFVRKLRQDNQRSRYLSHEEENRLVTILGQNPGYLYSLVVLAIETGMRKGEMLALTWEHVDLEKHTIYVQKSKSGKPRVVPLSHRAAIALHLLKKTSGPVFGPISFKRAWGTALRRAGISGLRFHDLRHTAASRWAERGADVYTIAALLGHYCIQTTMRYTHTSLDRMRAFVEGWG